MLINIVNSWWFVLVVYLLGFVVTYRLAFRACINADIRASKKFGGNWNVRTWSQARERCLNDGSPYICLIPAIIWPAVLPSVITHLCFRPVIRMVIRWMTFQDNGSLKREDRLKAEAEEKQRLYEAELQAKAKLLEASKVDWLEFNLKAKQQ